MADKRDAKKAATATPATRHDAPAPSGPAGSMDPFSAMREEMERAFGVPMGWPFGLIRARMGEPFRGTLAADFSQLATRADVHEIDGAYEITMELPGVDEKEVEISLDDDVLTIKGEKKAEREEKKKSYHLTERSYGSFQRSFRLPRDVDSAGIGASFAKGVLTVSMPKTEAAKSRQRRIEVKSS